jgi:hypothetical protein
MKIIFSLLFLLATTFAVSQELLQNGNFTSNNFAWSTTGGFSYNTTFSQYNFDIGYAYTEDDPNASGTLEQQVSIPSNSTSVELDFYTLINSDENTSTQLYDICTVNMFEAGGSGATHQFIMLSNLDENYASGYQQYTFTVTSNFHGTTVRLVFIFANDGATASRFRFDNVSLFATASGGGSSPDFYVYNETSNLTTVQAGSAIDVDCRQGNQGTLNANIDVYLGYYLSDDINLSGNDHFFSSDTDYSTLSPTDDDDPEGALLTIPSWVTTGTYYILFAADYDEQFVESNENNNVSSVPIYITNSVPAPTVTITAPSQYQCFQTGSSILIEADITGAITDKEIQYSDDGGQSWQFIWGRLKKLGQTAQKAALHS